MTLSASVRSARRPWSPRRRADSSATWSAAVLHDIQIQACGLCLCPVVCFAVFQMWFRGAAVFWLCSERYAGFLCYGVVLDFCGEGVVQVWRPSDLRPPLRERNQ